MRPTSRGGVATVLAAIPKHLSDSTPAPRRSLAIGRRAFDIAVASALLLITLPITALVAAAVLIEGGRPIFQRGWRVGRDGRIFRIYSFRSLVVAADQRGGIVASTGDRRLTRVGRVLRKTRLDDLPQLLNVLRGHMSVVGPRAEHPNYVRLYTMEQRRLLSVRPGITGAATVRYRNEAQLLHGDGAEALYRTVIMPEKIRLELEYLERRSFWSDLGLIYASVATRPIPAAELANAGRSAAADGGPREVT